MNFNVFWIFGFATVFILSIVQHISAHPTHDELLNEEPLEEIHSRIRRATCDLLSFQSKWVTPNHAACAAHCLALGKKGGRCKDAICHCRN